MYTNDQIAEAMRVLAGAVATGQMSEVHLPAAPAAGGGQPGQPQVAGQPAEVAPQAVPLFVPRAAPLAALLLAPQRPSTT